MITCTPIAIYRQRLLNAVRAVTEYDHSMDRIPGEVVMEHYVKPCGSPACILGHYAMRADLQDTFFVKWQALYLRGPEYQPYSVSYDSSDIREHFDINHNEADLLFGPDGCGDAKTARKVKRHITEFVNQKYPQWVK